MPGQPAVRLSAGAAAYATALTAALSRDVPPPGRERADTIMRELGDAMRTEQRGDDHARDGSLGWAICRALEHRIFGV